MKQENNAIVSLRNTPSVDRLFFFLNFQKFVEIMETLEIVFLLIEIGYYIYGAINIAYDKWNSIMCYGVGVLLFTILRLVLALVFDGEYYCLLVEIAYSTSVIIYGCCYQ